MYIKMSIMFFADSDNESYNSDNESYDSSEEEDPIRAQNCRTGLFGYKIRRRMQQMFFRAQAIILHWRNQIWLR